MLFKSQLLTQASGSAGGVTASRNRGGMYLRSRAIPTNPNTPRQQAVRAYLGAAAQAWTNDLTDAQRAAWTAYADATPVINRVGDSITLTGQNMFMRSSVVAMQTTGAMILDAPVINDTGEPVVGYSNANGDANQIDVITGTEDISFSVALASGASGPGFVALYAGRSQNQTINFFRGPYQFVGGAVIAAGDDNLEINISGLQAQQDQPFVAGQRRPVRLVVLYEDGRVAQAFETIATMTDLA